MSEKYKCPVCTNENEENEEKCGVCGFTELRRRFLTREDSEYWLATVVNPYRERWELKIQIKELLKELENLKTNLDNYI